MTKARDLASSSPVPSGVSTTELGYLDGVISSVQNQIDSKLSTSAANSTYAPLSEPVLTAPVIISPEERITVSSNAASGTIDFDCITQGILYYTSNASANWTLNVRGNSSNSLNTKLAINDSITVVFMATQGSTAYYASGFTIDGVAVVPKWQTGTAPTAGNASSIDVYVYNIIKTASATYTVLASQTKFA